MLKIRLQRIGRRNEPHFRAVVAESSRGPKSGNVIEVVGSYNPKLGNIQLNNERIAYWIQKGAQPSGTVHNFLVDAKIIDGPKINVLPKKTRIKKEGEDAPAEKPAAETPAAEEAPEAVAEEIVVVEDKVNAEGGEGDLGQAVAETPEEAPAEEVTAEEKVEA